MLLSVTTAPSTIRSELALAPLITPVMLKAPPLKVSTVPFLESDPERARVPPPVLRRVPVPLVTEMLRSMVAEPPV